jgi:YVTN family beta-propeller protein
MLCLTLVPAAPVLAAPFAYVANHGDDNVSIIDTATNQVTGTVDVGNHPLGVAVDPEGTRVYVSNQDGLNGSVSVITTGTNAVTPVPVGDDPTGVAVKLPGTRVYVANRVAKTVSVIDTVSNAVIATVPVENNPLGVAVNPAGTPAYVVNKGSDSLTVIDTNTNTVITTVSTGPPGSNPTHVAVSPAGDKLYVTNNGGAALAIINATSLSVTGTLAVGSFPEGVALSPDGKRAYVANSGPDNVSVIDTVSETLVTTVSVGDQPEDIAVHPDGSRVYVLNRGEKTVSVIDTATNTEIDTDASSVNGLTRIPVGIGPVGLGQFVISAFRPPRLDKKALACQTALAARARAYAKSDQGQQTVCENRILKDVADGKGAAQAQAACSAARDLGNPRSALARARSGAHGAIVKKCAGVAPVAIERPCDRTAPSVADATDCVLDQHASQVSSIVAATFASGDPQVLGKLERSCQATIAKGASQFAQTAQALLGGCIVRALKDVAKDKGIALSAAACAKALDGSDPKAALTKLRGAVKAKIVKKCAGLSPAALGGPCDPAATTIEELAECVLREQAAGAEKMVAAEFNMACPMLSALGVGRAYPNVCSGP